MHPAPASARTGWAAPRSVAGWRSHARASWSAVVFTCLAAFLPACSLGPRYYRPDVASPSEWRPSSAPVVREWPSADWWRGFRSPELDGYLAQAQRANDDLGAAIARVREADAQRRIAGAALFPTINADGNASRQRGPVQGIGVETQSGFDALLTVSYQLDLWGKNRAALRAATATAAASRFDRANVELTVLASVATTYFEALELRDRLSVAEQNLASARKILHGLELEQTVGTATALDVAQQATVVATLFAAIPPLQQQFRQNVDALAILVGSTPEAIDVTSGSLEELTPPEVSAGLPSQLLGRRPDVAEAEAQLIAANANIQVARASFFPTISLTGDGGFESSALSTLLKPASRVWSISAGLTQPIFAGGALRGQSEYAKARYSELLSDYHKAVISAFANVEDSLVALQQTTVQQERQQQAVDQARRAYQIAQAQMRAGTINVLTLLNTQSALFSAEDGLAQVRFARLQASVNLFKALGGGWQPGEKGGS
jgi:multidrug efflux system outer membrane protein